ncbi:KilA-N domain-containing protein [Pseudomonas indica]|uniref:KilA-N domain-containing protein n=1 Tax=Pseudomonas indica TaxID=137658 RepID=UPI0023F6D07A|nr:KilA-N domain-containing protein [Pseudomonas indica]MBU3054954.1 KilA-N domain-containing protein [Pseudomonas indica]
MNTDIKHKHAGHLIVIEGHAFRADDRGRWDLTDIWRTLKLPKGKAPAQWRTKQAKRLEAMQNLHSSNGSGSWATKRAALAYAAWVSEEFETVIFDAFEAILEKPEVALIVAEVMADIGHDHSAAILERHVFNDKCDWKAFGRRTPRKLTAEQKEIQKWSRRAAAEARKDRLNGREVC